MSDSFVNAVSKLVGKQVEMYTNEQRETLKFADVDHSRTCVLRGKLIEASGSCFVLQLKHPKRKEDKTYIICIQSWHVNSIMEYTEGVSISDFYEERGINNRRS